MTERILEPGEIEALAGSRLPRLRLPGQAGPYAERAQRLAALAPASPLAAYLRFMSAVCEAQAAALAALPPPELDAVRIAAAARHGMPVLPAQGGPPEGWRDGLAFLLERLRGDARVGPARPSLEALAAREPPWLDAQAAAILGGAFDALDLACAPLVAAALQIAWTARASRLTESEVSLEAPAALCPVCGYPPVASVVRIGGAEAGYRYLHCALCATEWHMVRVKCSSCGTTKGIDYRHVDGQAGAVRAECCAECTSYLKILYLDRDPHAEPAADDLASMALDLLLAEEGLARSGVNLLLFPARDPAQA